MLEKLKQQVYEANMELPRRNLVTYTWGNVSGIDRESGLVVIKPSGVAYDALTPEQLVVMDLDGNKVEGDLNPSSDTKTHLALYRAFPALGGIVHTHSTHAVAFAQARRDLPAFGTTHADYFYGPVPCTRELTPAEIEEDYELNTGKVIIETFRERGIDPVHLPAVLCASRLPRRSAGGGRQNGHPDPDAGPQRRAGAPACAGKALPAQARPQRLLRAGVSGAQNLNFCPVFITHFLARTRSAVYNNVDSKAHFLQEERSMKFYIDTANVDEIRKANDMGIIAGVTTNPSLIAKEGRDYAETLKEITTIVDGPISGEVKATTADAEGMIAEGRAIYALDPKHMVVKIPMTAEGLKAIKVLSAEGIPTNCTLIFSANQALLAARAGATYVSPFLGRLDDIGQPGIDLIETIHDMFLNYPDIDTQIIAASVRNPIHVNDCALAGADIATVPYKVIEQMIHHPLTDQGIEKFKDDYIKVFGE